jgi:hypothetical protein
MNVRFAGTIVLLLVALSFCIPVIALAQQTGGLPALQTELQTVQTNLQNQINNIQLKPGPTGPQGLQGPAGATGAVGPIGPMGPAGPKGDTGATGAQGPQGPVGAAGAAGVAGPQGAKGDTGAPGPAGSGSLAALSGAACTAADGNTSVLTVTVSADGSVSLNCPVPTEKIIFVSSRSYNGNMGGLAGADAACQRLASWSGYGGVFKAWLSDSKHSPSDRFSHSAHRYVDVRGYPVAQNWEQLVSGSLTYIPATDQRYSYSGPVWTATMPDGTSVAEGWNNNVYGFCLDWTSSDMVAEGRQLAAEVGASGWSDSNWTHHTTGVVAYTCNNALPIYCIQQ